MKHWSLVGLMTWVVMLQGLLLLLLLAAVVVVVVLLLRSMK